MRIRKQLVLAVSVLSLIISLLPGCDHEDPERGPIPYQFPDMKGFPTRKNIPADNPMTVEGVELGRYLFYDGRLGGRLHKDSLMACSTCHLQPNAFECGVNHPRFTNGHPRGIQTSDFPEGKQTPHVMLSVVNLVFNNTGYMWSGFLEETNEMTGIPGYDFSEVHDINFKNIEAFTYMAIVAEHEMNNSIANSVMAIKTEPLYPQMFAKAFGNDDITAERISMALSQFVRSIVSYRSRYHQWLRNETTLTDSELQGYDLFFSEKADCFHCHGGTVFMTNFEFANNAKDTVFTDPRDRFSITKLPWDIGSYRIPSLINVELNGPYMHDGRYQTLDEVIDFYSEGLVYSEFVHPLMKFVRFGGVQLTDVEKTNLKAFLLTLTDHELLTDPAYGPPQAIEEWVAH
jgi:cytochrome c peroxidase